jgi:hypothetical protein
MPVVKERPATVAAQQGTIAVGKVCDVDFARFKGDHEKIEGALCG